MFLVNAVQGTAGSTVPFTPGSVATHVSGDRLTLYVMGRETTLTSPDTPTATNGWVLVKSFLDPTTELFLYAFAIQATSSSMAAPLISFPGSTPNVTAWAMSSHRQTSGRYWKDPLGTAGNDGTTYGDYIFPVISGGSNYSNPVYPLPTDWIGNSLSAVFAVGAVPTDSSAALDNINTGFSLFNMSGGTNLRNTTQYVESSAGGGLAVVWWSRTGYSGTPLENVNGFFQLNPTTAMDGLVCPVIMREDTVAPPALPTAASGTASLTLSGTGNAGIPSTPASATAALSLSATGTAAEYIPPSDGSGTSWNNAKTLVEGNGNTFNPFDGVVGDDQPYNRGWWVFTAEKSGTVTLDTYQSTATDPENADTLIYVYNDATEPGDLNDTYASNDDTDEDSPPAPSGGLLSKLTFGITEGVTYHVLVGSYSSDGDTITLYRVNAVGLVYVPAPWTDEIRLTTDDDPFFDSGSDEGSLASGDLCHLGDNIVVVMNFSFYSYAVRLWAIDISGNSPVIGPMKVVNGTDADFSWMTNPHPGDPRGAAMYPCSFVVPTGSNTFAIAGPGNETYDASGNLDSGGDYVHVASFFEVDLDTLEITRTAFKVVAYDDLEDGWLDDLSMAPTEDGGVVVVSNSDADVIVAYPGSVNNYTFAVSNPNSAAPAVIDGLAHFLVLNYPVNPDDAMVIIMDVATGTFYQGPVLEDAGEYLTSFFATVTTDDRVAFLTSQTIVGNRSIAGLSIVDPDPSPFEGDPATPVTPESWTFGWTGDMSGNVRSISAMENGRLLVSYVEYFDRLMYFVEVGSTKAPGTPELIPFANPNGFFVQMARTTYGVRKIAAMQVRQTNSSYEDGTHIFGVYFAVRDLDFTEEPPEGPSDPYPARARSHFWGQ